MCVRSKRVEVFIPPQPDRVLIDKPPRMRVVVPEEVVMQPRFPVAILVLQPERLVRIGNIGFLREFAPAAIVAEPQQPSLAVGHLPRQADLVAVEVVDLPSGFARFVLPFANLRQRFIRILVGIDVGIASVRLNFLQQVAAVGYGFQTAFSTLVRCSGRPSLSNEFFIVISTRAFQNLMHHKYNCLLTKITCKF